MLPHKPRARLPPFTVWRMTCNYPELGMKILGDLRMLLLGLVSTTFLFGQVDAREIIRNAVAADERNWRIARNYTFLQRVELRRLDAQGMLKVAEVQTYDVFAGRHALPTTGPKRRPSVITRRREEGAGEPRQKYRRATARDRYGASQAIVRLRETPGLAAGGMA